MKVMDRPERRELPDDDFSAAELSTHDVVGDLENAAGTVNRAQADLFTKIIRCDLRRTWIEDDCRDIHHWVALRLGISIYKARRWVNCAWKLTELPRIADAFFDGDLSLDKVVELTRFATPDTEAKELAWAMKVAVSTIRDRGDYLARIAAEEVRRADEERSLKWFVDPDRARLSLYGSFPVADGMKITTAIDRLAATMAVSPADDGDASDPESMIDARRAGALSCLAGTVIDDDGDADRATVVVHAELAALVAGAGNASVGSSVALAPAVTGRFLCDRRLQGVVHGGDGAVVGIGTTSRLIPRWLRRAVEHRDNHRCTFPNCGSKAFLQVHHVVAWPQGPTDIDNLTLVCWAHHKLVHEHGWHVTLAPDQSARWFRPDWAPYGPRARPS
jgi:uncharacterized protein DUF222/HNH endonuclease